MNRIYTIGETIYDVIFKNGQPVSATPGGAMLNTSVSLGRLGLPVSFISEIGMDRIGQTIMQFLNKNNVNTDSVCQFHEGKTALAMAFLDEKENANYSFYKIYPEERLNLSFPDFQSNDILLFGSFFSITKEVRDPLVKILKAAKKNKAILIYDPNFRKPHLKDLPVVKKYIHENISYADIVRGSNEDFELIFGTKNPDDTFNEISKNGCHVLNYTCGEKSVEVRTNELRLSFPVPFVNLKSTIGAGDTFNSGIIYRLFKDKIDKRDISLINAVDWKSIVSTATSFAAEVCQSYDNYISVEKTKLYRV